MRTQSKETELTTKLTTNYGSIRQIFNTSQNRQNRLKAL